MQLGVSPGLKETIALLVLSHLLPLHRLPIEHLRRSLMGLLGLPAKLSMVSKQLFIVPNREPGRLILGQFLATWVQPGTPPAVVVKLVEG